ncbi:hypothetical protein WP7S18E06_02530 [Aeromonas hydrophila]|nr:hypothetical protein WP7S18E06_02530 [Aeromonas hydrophila]
MSTFFDFLLCNLALDHPNIRVVSGFDEKIDNKKGPHEGAPFHSLQRKITLRQNCRLR